MEINEEGEPHPPEENCGKGGDEFDLRHAALTTCSWENKAKQHKHKPSVSIGGSELNRSPKEMHGAPGWGRAAVISGRQMAKRYVLRESFKTDGRLYPGSLAGKRKKQGNTEVGNQQSSSWPPSGVSACVDVAGVEWQLVRFLAIWSPTPFPMGEEAPIAHAIDGHSVLLSTIRTEDRRWAFSACPRS